MFKISTVIIKGTGCTTHRREANGITNAGTGRKTTGVKEIQNVRGKGGEGTGCCEQAGTPRLDTDDDDDDPKRVKKLHSTDKRMTFVSQHRRRRGIFRLE
jgi:hypothetical protein